MAKQTNRPSLAQRIAQVQCAAILRRSAKEPTRWFVGGRPTQTGFRHMEAMVACVREQCYAAIDAALGECVVSHAGELYALQVDAIKLTLRPMSRRRVSRRERRARDGATVG